MNLLVSCSGGTEETDEGSSEAEAGVRNAAITKGADTLTNKRKPSFGKKRKHTTSKFDDDDGVMCYIPAYQEVKDTTSVLQENIFHDDSRYPEFPGGGVEELMRYLKRMLIYPQQAFDMGIEGTVYIRFTINRSGKVKNVSVLRGVSSELDKEAIRIIRSMPAWIPGRQNGRNVSVDFTIPITFTLE
ncbi:energy transducer TonB [uncultured Acetobacteroides sp.]|uniref:energy transducer TonB n=1 Tax=uncultured Acetobacteroides sp. TaxID=1760811 RepID=UPI0029F539B8|nr:energy transducer TonB [uncultured Acetobacteroides sp.]